MIIELAVIGVVSYVAYRNQDSLAKAGKFLKDVKNEVVGKK